MFTRIRETIEAIKDLFRPLPIRMPGLAPNWDLSPKGLDSKDVTIDHPMSCTLSYSINIPGHQPRSSSSLFNKTKRHLVDDLKTTCWVCGSSENLEVHHFHIEWSFANACNWDKFKQDHPEFENWDKLDKNNPSTFFNIVDAPENMMVLCKTHHVGKGTGIHALPYPVFVFQRYVKDNFKFINNIKSKGLFESDYVDDLDDLH